MLKKYLYMVPSQTLPQHKLMKVDSIYRGVQPVQAVVDFSTIRVAVQHKR